MKKAKFSLKNLSLNTMSKEASAKITGGECTRFGVDGSADCMCACAYANSGGSSTYSNGSANFDGGLCSPGCTVEPEDYYSR